MKRWLAKIVLFLVLGAVVNVAVAWGCAALSPLDRDPTWLDDSVALRSLQRFEIKRQFFETYPDARGFVWNGFGYRLSNPSLRRVHGHSYFLGPSYAVVESGWPFHCLEAQGRWSWERGPIATDGLRIDRDLDLSLGGPRQIVQDQRTIPLRPIWPGFAINTAFYATVLWLLTLTPFTARRVIRHKRGHCIKSGYDLRGDYSTGCPECGWRREDVP